MFISGDRIAFDTGTMNGYGTIIKSQEIQFKFAKCLQLKVEVDEGTDLEVEPEYGDLSGKTLWLSPEDTYDQSATQEIV